MGYGVTGTQNWPNFNAWLQTAWGSGASYEVVCNWFYGASNFVYGQNPPYYLDDFRAFYPKFFGMPTAVSGCAVEAGSNMVTVPSLTGVDYGQFVQSLGVLPSGSVVAGIGDGTIAMNTAALVTSSNVTLMIFESSPIPNGVILMYLRLAYASLVHARWQEQWWVAMGWFIAHYLTLYAKSDASEVFETLQTAMHAETPAGDVPGTVYTISSPPPGGVLQSFTRNGVFQTPGVDYTLNGATITTFQPTKAGDALYAVWPVQMQTFASAQPNGAQIAAQGLAGGIQTSKSVGDVSVGYQALTALEDWAAWGLTSYGQQLATMARVIGSGPALIW